VELVEIALVLHQRGARQIVEILDPARREVRLHRLHQRQVLAQRHRQPGGLELMEEGYEHSRWSCDALFYTVPAASLPARRQGRYRGRADRRDLRLTPERAD